MDGPDNRDLRAACFWATLVAIAVAASDDVFVRTIFGLPAALILPGYVLTRALGLKASSMLEYIVCMIGTSLASMVVGGFVLNIVGLLTPLGWATWLLTVVIAGSYMAARRHEPPALPRWSWPPGLRFRARDCLCARRVADDGCLCACSPRRSQTAAVQVHRVLATSVGRIALPRHSQRGRPEAAVRRGGRRRRTSLCGLPFGRDRP